MNKQETKFRKDFLDCVAQCNIFIDFQAHEDRYQGGIPDLSYGVNYINGWVELKWGLLLKFRPGQPRWLGNRTMHGGYCFVLQGNADSVRLYDLARRTCLHWEKPMNVGVANDVLTQLSQPLRTEEKGILNQDRDTQSPVDYFKLALGVKYYML